MPLTELWLSNVSRYSPSGVERIGFADQLERLRGIRGEDDEVLVGIGIEELEHRQPRLFDERRGQGRRWIGGMRIAEQVIAKQRGVRSRATAARGSRRCSRGTRGRPGRAAESLARGDRQVRGWKRRTGSSRASTSRVAVQAIVTFRGYCELSSRNVFLLSSSSSVGCTRPLTSVTRDTIVCSPGVASFHA